MNHSIHSISILRLSLIALLWLAFSQQHSAQVSFSVSDTLAFINKTTITPAAYAHIDLYNTTEAPLQMRWVKRYDTSFPEGWSKYLQDPDTWHNPFDNVDSADFNLSVDTQYNNMMIFQVVNNGYTGAGNISFLLFPIDNRADSVRITFRTIITPAVLGIEDLEHSNRQVVHPQPNNGKFCILESDESHAEVYTTEGRFVRKYEGVEGCFDMRGLPPAMYFVYAGDGRSQPRRLRLIIAQ